MRVRGFLSGVWKLRWVLVLNAYLVSPLVVSSLVLKSTDIPLKLMAFTVVASVFWLLALQTTFRRPWVVHAFLAPFYLVVGADLFVILVYDTRLTSSMLSVIFENVSDAKEYLAEYLKPVLLTLGATVTVYVVGMSQVRRLELRAPRLMALGAWGVLGVTYTAVYLYANDLPHLAGADRSSPLGVIPQSYLAYRVYEDVLGQAERTKDFTFGAKRAEAPPAPETYILVIGESCRPDHWALYDYPRDTNPRLTKEPNLITFRDVVAQASFTKAAVPFILTRGSASDQDIVAREKSIVSVFGELGFLTGWFSTQSRDPFTGAINRFSGEAAVQQFVERKHDEVLLKMVRSTLSEAGEAKPRRFFVVHTMGSHFSTTNRYPRSFAVLPDEVGPGVSEHQALVNSYDNSIRYADFVLHDLIEGLRETGGIAGLLYISDHGENLRDDERQLFGHYYYNEFDLPVPMLFWYSDAWASRYPEKLAAARRAAEELKLSSRAVFHSLVDMAGATVGDPNTQLLSVFSASAKPPARLVNTDKGTFDYDLDLYKRHAKASTK